MSGIDVAIVIVSYKAVRGARGLWSPRRLDRNGRQNKALSVRDFYLHDGRRLGYVQSLGLDASTIRIPPVRRFIWR
jgi:hypothetical protein